MKLFRNIDMQHWLDKFETLRCIDKQIDAHDFNQIRLAVIRNVFPKRFDLGTLRCASAILEESAWIVMDDIQNRPLLAWREFEHRDELFEPISCKLHLINASAGLVMGFALEALVETAKEFLKPDRLAANAG